MNSDESFLARWSRRKRGATPDTPDQPKPENAGGDVASEAFAASVPPGETQSCLDPASLPAIESIGAGSDIQAFLAAGVPADLMRAALRRAWSADPTIRDFIGLSENSWDFNAPGGVPGFGSVSAEDVRRLLAQVMGEPEAADPARPAPENLSADQAPVPASQSGWAAHGAGQERLKQDQRPGAEQSDPMPRDQSSNIAMQHETGERECCPALPRRRHGGALPE